MKYGCLGLAVAVALVTPRSAAADPAADRSACIAAAEKAQSLRDEHKLLAARDQLRICGRAVCSAAVLKDCIGWLAETEASLPAIVLAASDGAGHDLVDVSVKIDGVVVRTRLDGAAIDVDPGEHAIVFETPGRVTDERRIVARSGERHTVVSATLPLLGAAPAAPPAGPPAAPTPLRAVTPVTLREERPNDANRGDGQRAGGWVTAALGAVGLGIGLGFGIDAIALHSQLTCTGNVCTPADTLHSAKVSADVATVGVIAGGVLAAVGITLVLTSERPAERSPAVALRVSPRVDPSARGIDLALTW